MTLAVREDLINVKAQSPFLPDTNVQWAWDSTSLGWLKTCPRLYQYSMIEGWRKKSESIHLRFGIEVHQAFHEYDILRTAGASHNAAVLEVVGGLFERTNDFRPDHKHKNRSNLIRTVIWQLDKYPTEDDPARTYILADGKPACEMSFRFELDVGPEDNQAMYRPDGPSVQPYVICGHLDKVVEFQDELFVKDYKTTTSTPSDFYFSQFEPNNQMSLYTLAGQIVLSAPIKGVIIDAMQVAVNFTRPFRGMTYRTKDQLDEWLRDTKHWLSRAKEYAIEGYWPQNDTACDKYGGCAFRQICSKSPNVRGAFLKAHFTQEDPWNPLAVR